LDCHDIEQDQAMFVPGRRQLLLGGALVVLSETTRTTKSEPLVSRVTAEESEFQFIAHTDAGMLAVWNAKRFSAIRDYASWAKSLETDEAILRHLTEGYLVPINIGSDGVSAFTVRINRRTTAQLTNREAKYVFISSEPYLFVSSGEMCLSGIEHISASPDTALANRMALEEGRYQVTVHLIAWDDEPGSRNENGAPAAHALPDFVILISPDTLPTPPYRMKLETFDRPQ
jgi:hypothetical protein